MLRPAARRRARSQIASLLLLSLPTWIVACDGDGTDLGTNPSAVPTERRVQGDYLRGHKPDRTLRNSTLEVTISDVPAGATPAVTVNGPGEFDRPLTTSETLSGLAEGTYIITAASLDVSGVAYTPTPVSQ